MGGWGKYKKKFMQAKMSAKKCLQAETEEKKILAEGNLPLKVKCQGIIIKIPFIVMTANFLENALKQRF